jgi:putative FmdB family regulatory protein
MPIYEYVCVDCRKQFDALRSMGDADDPIECVYCGSSNTSRTISVFFAQSGGKVLAGGAPNCSTCSSSSCATCKPG